MVDAQQHLAHFKFQVAIPDSGTLWSDVEDPDFGGRQLMSGSDPNEWERQISVAHRNILGSKRYPNLLLRAVRDNGQVIAVEVKAPDGIVLKFLWDHS